MNTIWSSQDLSLALNQEVKFNANQAQFNSIDIKAEDFFIAIRGNNDGHNYVKDALNRGASFAIVQCIPEGLSSNDRLVLVDNTYQALLDLAYFRRNQSKAKFIAITGSCGKTSTKTNLAKILNHFGKTFSSSKSFNNHLGVPITLASIPLDAKYAIIEIGTNHPGEIKPLTQMAKPHVAIITNIAPSHIGNFDSIYSIVEEKSQIFQGLTIDAIAIIHRDPDDKIFEKLKTSAKLAGAKNVLTFGEQNSDCTLLNYKLLNQNTAAVDFKIGNIIFNFKTHITGKHQITNLLAIILITSYLEFDVEEIIRLFDQLEPLEGRGELLNLNKFDIKFSVIDDSYNANPLSTRAALENLAQIQSSKKVAVLADMLELGSDASDYHKNLKQHLINSGVYKFIAVGPLMKNLYDVIDEGITKYYFEEYKTFSSKIHDLIDSNDIVLFKGSNGTNLHQVVNFLKQE
jgi:UDP-N-acetylmuramoyl-tripeptide--D-alanyl-D-alanine ligase